MAISVIAFVNRPAADTKVSYELADDYVLAGSPLVSSSDAESVEYYLQRFARSGDTRFLRYSKEKLNRVTSESLSDSRTMLQRARILSAEHRFGDAAAVALEALPGSVNPIESRLLAADSFRRAGQLTEARRQCFALGVTASPELGKWCAVQLLLSGGEAQQAFSLASRLLPDSKTFTSEVQQWTLEIAAEAAALAGEFEEATRLYEELVATDTATFSARLAYTEMLIATGKPARVLTLLEQDVSLSSAQVRIVIAQKMLGLAPDTVMVSEIEKSFARMSAGDAEDLRVRDRAIFEMYFNEDTAAAVAYAQANWEQQKGPEDLHLLRLTANAARDAEAMQRVSSWESAHTTRLGES